MYCKQWQRGDRLLRRGSGHYRTIFYAACKGAKLPLGELLKLDELDPPDLPTTEEFLKELNLGSLPLAY